MESTATNLNPFEGFFDKNKSAYEIDLSKSTLMDVLDAYETFKRKTNPKYEIGSIRYHIAKIQLMTNHILMPMDITDMFYTTLQEYLNAEGVCHSSQETYLGKIRCSLEWGKRHNCPLTSTYDTYDIPTYHTFAIALTPDEVSHIAHFDVSKLPFRSQHRRTLERVRDMFVLSCNLGQRFSDMVRISKENFNRNVFSCTQKKTGNKARLNIDVFAITPDLTYKLLNKYNYEAPYKASIGNYNYYLHELVNLIGEEFHDTYKRENKINGEMKDESIGKWELIASHTARRTFVTFNAKKSIPLHVLSRATGHSQLSSLQKYIKDDNDE